VQVLLLLLAPMPHLAACVAEVQRQHKLLEQKPAKSLRHAATGDDNSNR
jgi:hypothetical protein